MKSTKKVLFIFSFVILATNITLAHTNHCTNSQQENSTFIGRESRSKARRLTMKDNCMQAKQKSSSSFVLQFDDKLSVSYRTKTDYTIQITNTFGQVLHNQLISGDNQFRTDISLLGYQAGEYTIKLIISENEYSYGIFIIE